MWLRPVRDVWIETCDGYLAQISSLGLRPVRDVWIETLCVKARAETEKLRPVRDVWIETS